MIWLQLFVRLVRMVVILIGIMRHQNKSRKQFQPRIGRTFKHNAHHARIIVQNVNLVILVLNAAQIIFGRYLLVEDLDSVLPVLQAVLHALEIYKQIVLNVCKIIS